MVGRWTNLILIVALVPILAFIVSLALSHGSSESSLGHDLQSHGVRATVTVTVTAAAPSNHDYFAYGYMVEGSHYSGDTASFTSGQTVNASQLHFGEHIAVIYDANNPERSCSCDINLLASSAWSNDLGPLVIVIPGTAVMVFALLRRHRNGRRADG